MANNILSLRIRRIITCSIFILFSMILFSSCHNHYQTKKISDSIPDTLRVVTLSSSTTYFEYRGISMGYQFELLKLYAQSINKPYEIIIARDNKDIIKLLDSAKADICITPIAPTIKFRKKYNFVGLSNLSGMLLVQRRPSNKGQKGFIHTVAEMAGHTITVPKNTRYDTRLKAINEQLGGTVDIVTVPQDSLSSEDLIRLVSEGKVKATISDEILAKISATYYNNIDVSVPAGFSQKLQWIVPKRLETLSKSISHWANNLTKKTSYKSIYKRYFELSKSYDTDTSTLNNNRFGHKRQKLRLASALEYHHNNPIAVSPYDNIFKDAAKKLHWPWELLASIAWHESRFQPTVIGWSGARGLMGIMPSTGRIFKAKKAELLNPKVSVRVAVDCLLATEKYFDNIKDEPNRMALTLAAYNAGVGHIRDAQNLARKLNYNPNVWNGNVEVCVQLKREPKYYNDPVCKYGYLRGDETTNYVRNVMSVYNEYIAAMRK